MNPLLTLDLQKKRDLVLARQRARQIAGLLGFDLREQGLIAAGVFAIAHAAFRQEGHAAIEFRVEADALKVMAVRGQGRAPWLALLRPGPSGALRLEKPLPKHGAALAREDLAWAVRELAGATPENVFEEIQQQNQELLRALQDLQACQAELDRLRPERQRSAAA